MKIWTIALMTLIASLAGATASAEYKDYEGRVLSVQCGEFDPHFVGDACVIDLQLLRSHGFATLQLIVWNDAERLEANAAKLEGAVLSAPRTDLRKINDRRIFDAIRAPRTTSGVFELLTFDRVTWR